MAYEWIELWGWEEKGELEKIIMLDYVDYKWIFKLDVCTPRCVIMRELDRLKGCLTQRGLSHKKILNLETQVIWSESAGRKNKAIWNDKYGERGLL